MNSFILRIWENDRARAGIIILLVILVLTLVGPFFVPSPTAYLGVPLSPPSFENWFGTTGQGQSVIAQTLVGGRPTLMVAFGSATMVLSMACIIGGIAGYCGGKVDNILNMLINVFLLLPGLPLMVVLAAWLPPGPVTLMMVLSLTGWAWSARVIRTQVAIYRERDFVRAAQLAGIAHFRIILFDILPNILSLLLSTFIGAAIYAIGAQVGLEFLGLGDVSIITWGTNLYWASNDAALLTGSWWTFVPTGLCIALVAFSLTLIGYGMDEINNPRLQSTRHWKKRVSSTARPDWTEVHR